MGGAPFSIDAEDEAETMLHRADMGRSSAAPVRNRGGGCWAESDRRLSHDVTERLWQDAVAGRSLRSSG
jgi:hypothetical protein